MTFKNGRARRTWEQRRATSGEPYFDAILNYAEQLADLLESRMAQSGFTIDELARKATYDADPPEPHVVTIYQYSWAIYMLADVWKWGVELREWHNHHWGQMGFPWVHKDGMVWPSMVDRPDGHGLIVGSYKEIDTLPSSELAKLVEKAETADAHDPGVRIQADACPACAHKLNGVSEMGGSTRQPRPGDFSLCEYCGAYLRFGPNLELRLASGDEIENELSSGQRAAMETMGRALRKRWQ